MRHIRRALARVASIVKGRSRREADFRAEMQSHLEMETAELIRRGLPPDEARRRAMVASGGLSQAAENVREERGLPWLEQLATDVRYAFRRFRRTPLSTATMVGVLSLGIGTNVVLFAILNSIATAPPKGVERDASLVRIRGIENQFGIQSRLMAWPEAESYAQRTDVFSDVAAYAGETALVTTSDAATAPFSADIFYTTSNYFSTLGVHPSQGREPVASDGGLRMTTSPSAMISHSFWQQRLGGAADAIGRTIRINGSAFDIVGIAPPGFAGVDGNPAIAVWVPLAVHPLVQNRTTTALSSYDSTFVSVFARLAPGVSRNSASVVAASIAERSPSSVRDTNTQRRTADVVPMLASNSRVTVGNDLLIASATAGGFSLLVLLITCTNVSALMVGLAVARRREIGVRLSLGAPRRRLIRQLLTETVVLSLIAGVIGLMLTAVGTRVVESRFADVQLAVDWRVTLATFAVAIATGILFGLSPALHATRISVGEILKSSATAVAATRSRLQRTLVIAQIALTQPLLVGMGVVITTIITDASSRATNTGSAEQIVEVELNTFAGRVTDAERATRIDALVRRVAGLPGVVAAVPMQMGTVTAPLAVYDADVVPGRTNASMQTHLTAAPKGYFDIFGIRIVRGRDFDAGELVQTSVDPGQPLQVRSVVIGSDLARKLWGDGDPIGRRLIMATGGSSPAPMTVVGVVDERMAGPSEVNGVFRVYVPYSTLNTGVIARTAGPAAPMVSAMRKAAMDAAPAMPVVKAQTVAQREAQFRSSVFRTSALVATAGVIALLLSAVGLYAVVALIVGQRTREIGIRIALGAQRGQVVRLFFMKGIALGAIGLVLGLPLSMLATRYIASSLNWPLSSSPFIGVAIGGVVLLVASVAAWIPARRASSVDPVVAVRAE